MRARVDATSRPTSEKEHTRTRPPTCSSPSLCPRLYLDVGLHNLRAVQVEIVVALLAVGIGNALDEPLPKAEHVVHAVGRHVPVLQADDGKVDNAAHGLAVLRHAHELRQLVVGLELGQQPTKLVVVVCGQKRTKGESIDELVLTPAKKKKKKEKRKKERKGNARRSRPTGAHQSL